VQKLGYPFKDRFKSEAVEQGRHSLALARYTSKPGTFFPKTGKQFTRNKKHIWMKAGMRL